MILNSLMFFLIALVILLKIFRFKYNLFIFTNKSNENNRNIFSAEVEGFQNID